jgi:hypothetical protein
MKKSYSQRVRGIWLALIGIGLLHSQIIQAQSIPDVQWSRSGKTLTITTDGNIVTSNNGPQVVKYDLQGSQVWEISQLAGASYLAGKLPPEFCPCIGGYGKITDVLVTAPIANGGVAVSGIEYGGRLVFTSLNNSGTQEGVSRYGGGTVDMITSNDGGYLFLNTGPDLTGKVTTSVEKLGNSSWTTQLAYPGSPAVSATKGEAIINTPDGGYLVVGYYNTTGRINDIANSSLTDNTGWIAKLDGGGNIVWQKLLDGLPLTNTANGLAEGTVIKMLTITDVIMAADGNGFALVGAGIGPSSRVSGPAFTALLEIDANGNFKRAKSIDATPTKAFITRYNGADNGNHYAVGNTSLANGTHPHILKISAATVSLSDPALFSVITQRTFDSDGYLQGLDRAGDGSLVLVTNNGQVLKLRTETPPITSGLTISAPTYNCRTGAITFNVSGGNGSPITYFAPGISRASVMDNFGTVEQGLRNDPKVIPITAMQNGVSVTYNFDLKAACNGGTTNPPATLQPPRLIQPIPDQSLIVGQSSNIPIGTYFSDPNLGTPNYTSNWDISATGLPPGLSISAKTSELPFTPAVIVVGTPTSEGVYTVTVTASTGNFRSNPVVTTFKITISNQSNPNPPTGSALMLTAPTYNCQTGAITFNVSGGNGSTITYLAPGISRASVTDNFGTVEPGLRGDPKVIPITATQNGVSVTYNFDLKAACSGGTVPDPSIKPPFQNRPIPDQSLTVGQSINFPLGSYFTDPTANPSYRPNWFFRVSGLPPGLNLFIESVEILFQPAAAIVGNPTTTGVYTVTVAAGTAVFSSTPIVTTFKITVSTGGNPNPPAGSALTLLAPVYDCATGAFTFRTSGGDGSPIEFFSFGITGWTTNPNQFVDKDSRTANDVQPFMLMARQSGQVVTYVWNLKVACNRQQARESTNEPGAGLQVRVLGNPITGETAEIEISGVVGKAVHLQLVDSRGRLLHRTNIQQAETLEQISIPTGNSQGILLLQVGTNTDYKRIKLLKP